MVNIETLESLTKINLFGEEKTFDDCGLDDVIMSPDTLIRVDAFTSEEMNAILENEEKAAAVCKKVVGQFTNINL
jgi:hypothetical protein